MPRLLLVDDNPSIHKIAESLLAHTQIEMVCAESGQKALDLIESSSPFDVALIDISMAGMDGWELLDQLRAAPGTARLPIAMMAGVLDTVDPDRLAKAAIQGFLKKPVELRDLADRIQVLLDTPVPEPVAEPEPSSLPEVASPFETLPAQNLTDLQARLNTDDILELTEEDLYPEEEAQPSELSAEQPLEEELDLEELDLEGLKDLSAPESLAPVEEPVPAEATTLPDLPLSADIITLEDLPEPMDEDVELTEESPFPSQEPAPEPEPLELPVDALEEVLESPFPEPVEEFTLEMPEEPAAEPSEEVPAFASSLDELLAAPILEMPGEPVATLTEVAATATPMEILAEQAPVQEPIAALPEAPVVAAPPVEAPAEQALVQQPQENATVQALAAAIMADPALMGALAKAVAAQLSDKALREVAWEIMPEIAERQKLL